MYPGSRDEWEAAGQAIRGCALAVDLDGVAALAIGARAPYPGSVEFDLRGTRIVVVGDHDVATLQAVARSILDRSRS